MITAKLIFSQIGKMDRKSKKINDKKVVTLIIHLLINIMKPSWVVKIRLLKGLNDITKIRFQLS